MQEKNALVTGATHGIGLALTKKLLLDGFHVFGCGRNEPVLSSIARESSSFTPIRCNLTCNKDIENLVNVIEKSGRNLSLNVQNAGMKSPPRALHYYDCASIDDVFNVNLLAPMKLTALLMKHMVDGGRILYLTSRAATLKLEEGSTYCASKAGLDEVAAIVRKEIATAGLKIGVASVIPGEVDTNIQKILRETPNFHLKGMFQRAYEAGQLISPEVCADFLYYLLVTTPFSYFAECELPQTIYDEKHHGLWLKDPKRFPAFPF